MSIGRPGIDGGAKAIHPEAELRAEGEDMNLAAIDKFLDEPRHKNILNAIVGARRKE